MTATFATSLLWAATVATLAGGVIVVSQAFRKRAAFEWIRRER